MQAEAGQEHREGWPSATGAVFATETPTNS